MMLKRTLTLVIAGFSLLVQTSSAAEPKPWVALFDNVDLKGWDTYIGPAYDPIKKEFAGEPLGLNKDPEHVFSVVDIDGQKAIHVSGAGFGGLSTVAEYSNYQLELEYKWGKAKYPPRQDAKPDSGLLYHATGPHGADWFFWMRSFEFQIQVGDSGEYWGCGGAIADSTAQKGEGKDYFFSPGAPLSTFSQTSPLGRHVQKAQVPSAEKPIDQWNQVTLYALGDTSVHVVNSVVMMVLKNPRQILDGKEVPLQKGKIQLQSEGAEVLYRNIRLRPISELPRGLLPATGQAKPAPVSPKP